MAGSGDGVGHPVAETGRPRLDVSPLGQRSQLAVDLAARHVPEVFPWVWTAVLLLLASGYSMVFMVFGGFAGAGLHVHLMQGIGWLMIALFVWLFHGPWLAFKSAVDAEDWPKAGTSLERIRQIISINLPLGLIVVLIGASGRFWS